MWELRLRLEDHNWHPPPLLHIFRCLLLFVPDQVILCRLLYCNFCTAFFNGWGQRILCFLYTDIHVIRQRRLSHASLQDGVHLRDYKELRWRTVHCRHLVLRIREGQLLSNGSHICQGLRGRSYTRSSFVHANERYEHMSHFINGRISRLEGLRELAEPVVHTKLPFRQCVPTTLFPFAL